MTAPGSPARSLSIVCPVFNEEAVIADFHRELTAMLDGLKGRYEAEVIYVVDPCPDRTVELVRGLAERDGRVRALVFSSRFGHQNSLLAGIDVARGDAIVMLDSDLQHPPAVVPQLLEQFERGNDVVLTLRDDGAAGIGFARRLASTSFYRILNFLSDVEIREGAADFRLISRRVAEVFRIQIRERNQFLRGLVGWVGFKTATVRFSARERGGGRSKYSMTRLLRFATEGVVSFSKRPLAASIWVGFLFAFCGLLLAVITLFQWLYYKSLPPGWTTIVILLSVMSGVQLIFLGVIGLYVGFIFDEVKGRPHYIVDERIGFGPRAQEAPKAADAVPTERASQGSERAESGPR